MSAKIQQKSTLFTFVRIELYLLPLPADVIYGWLYGRYYGGVLQNVVVRPSVCLSVCPSDLLFRLIGREQRLYTRNINWRGNKL